MSVDEQPIEVVGDLSAHRVPQANDVTVVNNSRARLEVEFEVSGELSPNTPITVHLEGVATEDISEGEVQLALPTFAAMELAGSDKRPKYVPGGKAPVVASWPLPKMDAGDHWKQSVEIGSVEEKGYYQISAFAKTDGDFKSPHVFDDVFHERWLYIADGGGSVTRVFDESVFPDNIVPGLCGATRLGQGDEPHHGRDQRRASPRVLAGAL